MTRKLDFTKKSFLQLAKEVTDALLLSVFQGIRGISRITRVKRSETPRHASLRTSEGRPRRFSRIEVRVYAGVVKRVTNDAQKCCCKKHVSHPPGQLSYQATIKLDFRNVTSPRFLRTLLVYILHHFLWRQTIS